MSAPDAYVLPFRPDFDAPTGAMLECRGMSGWRYRDPRTGADVTFRDSQANSYARHGGGMVGTLWLIVGVQPNGSLGVLVTLEPA